MLTTDGFRLDGKVAIVTGSGRNIGRAVAESFAAAGAKVVVNGRQDRAAVDAVVRGIIERGGQAAAVMADVSKDDEVRRLVETTVTRFGAPDIVVSNVGIRRYKSLLEITPEEWREVIDTNLSAAFFLARHAIPRMQAKRRGRFIVVSGFDGFWGQVTHRAHNIAAKAGLHGLAKAIAREIDTERDWSQYPHQSKETIAAEIPLRRFGHVDELAGACLFLASDAGGFVSGQVIHVNGGHYMY
jgi:NAD(P)-dependent dehydrogenase (short-subunit alcohol dehydrogenase family)